MGGSRPRTEPSRAGGKGEARDSHCFAQDADRFPGDILGTVGFGVAEASTPGVGGPLACANVCVHYGQNNLSAKDKELQESRSTIQSRELQIKVLEDKAIKLEEGLKTSEGELNGFRAQLQNETKVKDDISNDLLNKSILYEELLDELHDCLRTGEAVCANVVQERYEAVSYLELQIKTNQETAAMEMERLREDHKTKIEALSKDHTTEMANKTKEHESALTQKFADGVKQGAVFLIPSPP
jgi:hypothetical protein